MNVRTGLFSLLLTASLSACSTTAPPTTPTMAGPAVSTPADAQTLKVVDAAVAFLDTLSDAQKTKVQFAYSDDAQRANWTNLPGGVFQRAGLRWGDLSVAQHDAIMAMLSNVLSTDGTTMVKQMMAADDEQKRRSAGGPPPGVAVNNAVLGSNEYYISFVGTPSATTAWTLQFGGHHMGLNATVAGSNITLAPSITGGMPVRVIQDGKQVYIIEKIEKELTSAYALVGSLDDAQRAKAVLSPQPIDLILGPGQDGKVLQPQGLAGSAMTAEQKTLLLTLIKDRLGQLNADDLAVKMTAIEQKLDTTYFAWYGPTTAGGAAYFSVSGPTVLIEFSPQGLGGDPTAHLHNMYRDPTNDYGASWIKR
jgi:Protein of unknown function (DUF3500)